MRTHQSRARYFRCTAEDISVSVQIRQETSLGQLSAKPATRGDIGFGERDTVDSRFEFSELGKLSKITKQPLSTDFRHNVLLLRDKIEPCAYASAQSRLQMIA